MLRHGQENQVVESGPSPAETHSETHLDRRQREPKFGTIAGGSGHLAVAGIRNQLCLRGVGRRRRVAGAEPFGHHARLAGTRQRALLRTKAVRSFQFHLVSLAAGRVALRYVLA